MARALNPKSDTSDDKVSKRHIWGLAYPEIDSLYFHAPWLHAYGGRVIKEGQPRLNSEAMASSMKAVHMLRKEGLIPPEVDGALASELFRTQKLAFLINGPWFIAELQSNKAQRWAVAPLPKLSETGAPLTPYLSVEGVVLSSRSRSPKRALKLARYLASRDRALTRVAHGELVANSGLDHALDTQAPPWLKVFHHQLTSSIPLSNEPLMKSLWTPMKRALAQVIIYQADPNKSLKAAQNAVVRMTNRGEDHE
jgi:arabinogalactan oligomer/maltooligosaccharide transport system permease protein